MYHIYISVVISPILHFCIFSSYKSQIIGTIGAAKFGCTKMKTRM